MGYAYAYARAVVLHPDISSYLAAYLFVHGAVISSLGELVRHGATHHECRVRPTRAHVERYTDIEATTQPFGRRRHGDVLLMTKTEVVFGERSDGVALFVEFPVQLFCCPVVFPGVDVVVVLVDRLVERDTTAIEEVENGSHCAI